MTDYLSLDELNSVGVSEQIKNLLNTYMELNIKDNEAKQLTIEIREKLRLERIKERKILDILNGLQESHIKKYHTNLSITTNYNDDIKLTENDVTSLYTKGIFIYIYVNKLKKSISICTLVRHEIYSSTILYYNQGILTDNINKKNDNHLEIMQIIDKCYEELYNNAVIPYNANNRVDYFDGKINNISGLEEMLEQITKILNYISNSLSRMYINNTPIEIRQAENDF